MVFSEIQHKTLNLLIFWMLLLVRNMTKESVNENTPLSGFQDVPNEFQENSTKRRFFLLRWLMGDFPTLLRVPKIFTFLAASLIMISSGFAYAYSMISPQIQDIMGYSIMDASLVRIDN